MSEAGAGAPADIIVIGAGAAGLAAAIFAAEEGSRRGRKLRIILVDGARKPGAKILVSGGGRCNVTNINVTEEDYCGGSPKIIRNVLARFDNQQTIAWMQSLGVEMKLESTGKFFPITDSARTVLDALMNHATDLGIEMCFGRRVENIAPIEERNLWRVTLAPDHATLLTRTCIVATGGKALPKSGSDGASYAWLQRLGHTLVPPVPALAPLILDERGVRGYPLGREFAALSGISLDATLTLRHALLRPLSISGSILFTHFGLSGPTPMNISRHIARIKHSSPHDPVMISMSFHLHGQRATAAEWDKWLLERISASPQASLENTLSQIMPSRLAGMMAPNQERLKDLRREERVALAASLAEQQLLVKGDRGFSFAEATAGGIPLDEIRWKTMESRKATGLFLCGEVLDVDGRIGGFNFQWAWASGFGAGISAAQKACET